MDTNRTRRPLPPLTPTQAAVLKAARFLNDGWNRDTIVRASLGALKPGPITQAMTVLRNQGRIQAVPSTFTDSGWGYRVVR